MVVARVFAVGREFDAEHIAGAFQLDRIVQVVELPEHGSDGLIRQVAAHVPEGLNVTWRTNRADVR